jgi:Glycosyltransferase 61
MTDSTLSVKNGSINRKLQSLFVPSIHFGKRAILNRQRTLETQSTEKLEFSKPTQVKSIPFFFLQEQLDRIKRSPSFEPERLISEFFYRDFYQIARHGAYQVKDAWLIDGSIFPNGAPRIDLRNQYSKKSLLSQRSLLPKALPEEIELGSLTATIAGSSWFGHWLEDELPLIMRSEEFGPAVAHQRKTYKDESAYLAFTNLRKPYRGNTLFFKKLWIFDDFLQNPNKVARYHKLRARLDVAKQGSETIFLDRGSSGNVRYPDNGEAMLSEMARRGVKVIDLASSELVDLKLKLRHADTVISIEGSHLAHALYLCPRGAQLIIIAPPNLAHTTVADLAPFFGLSSAMFISNPLNVDGSRFSVNTDELFHFIDKSQKSRSTRMRLSDDMLACIEKIPQTDITVAN